MTSALAALTPEEYREAMTTPPPLHTLLKHLRRHTEKSSPESNSPFCLRLMIATESLMKARRMEIGLSTGSITEAIRRAGEIVSLCYFCGYEIRSKNISPEKISLFFPIADLSDEPIAEEADPGFIGGNAGLPFFINWASDTPVR